VALLALRAAGRAQRKRTHPLLTLTTERNESGESLQSSKARSAKHGCAFIDAVAAPGRHPPRRRHSST